jgi:sugar phosphate isomerase/epimerase
MRTIQGPGIFLAQFIAPEPPYDRLDTLADWAAAKGYRGVQVPTFAPHILDLAKAAESRGYCEEIKGVLATRGLEITELSTHRQGHCVAVHPAYDLTVDVFAPPQLRGRPQARQEWAVAQLRLAARASANLGLSRHVSFPGSLLWPYLYLYPPRPFGLVEEGFDELARRWRPILDAFDAVGVDLCFEIHPGEDLHDGVTFEMFLERVGGHPRANILYDPSHLHLQGMDYVGFIEAYAERIRCMHVKDAEVRRSPRTGLWGGYQNWPTRAGRFRSPGDGEIDFGVIFAKLAEADYAGWAVVEWECCIKHPDQGAAEGAQLVRRHIIEVQARAFDANMQAQGLDRERNRRVLGLTADDERCGCAGDAAA